MRRARSAAQLVARRIRARLQSTAIVLMYHRVTSLPRDPLLLTVSPQHFAEHLEVLSRDYHVIPLSGLRRDLGAGKLQPRSVVITFDDGYADNLYEAKPLLWRHGLPATVFVTVGPAYESYSFWWDELAEALLTPSTVPLTLRLQVDGREREWQLGTAAQYDTDAALRHQSWNILVNTDPTPRHALFRQLLAILRPMPHVEQRRILNDLMMWSGRASTGPQTSPAMIPDEIVALCHGDLVDIGAHTVTHPVLSTLSRSAQRAEIIGSRARLQKTLGRPIAYFAFPFGSTADHNGETAAVIAEAAFEGVCTTQTDLVWQNSTMLQLPRMVVRDWSGEQFAKMVSAWFSGLAI